MLSATTAAVGPDATSARIIRRELERKLTEESRRDRGISCRKISHPRGGR